MTRHAKRRAAARGAAMRLVGRYGVHKALTALERSIMHARTIRAKSRLVWMSDAILDACMERAA